LKKIAKKEFKIEQEIIKIENFIKDLQFFSKDFKEENQKGYRIIVNYNTIIEFLSDNLASWLIFINK